MLKGHLGEGTELQTQIIQQQLEEGNNNAINNVKKRDTLQQMALAYLQT